jgi:surfeit locus 1 family protein
MTLRYRTKSHCITFSPHAHITLVTLLATTLFFSLGVWQLKRADEKKMREQCARMAEKKAPAPLPAHPRAYQRIQVTGQYLDQTLFLDHQYEQHQLGYHVFTPLLLENNWAVVIDRGWIKKQDLSKIQTPSSIHTIKGQIYFPSSKEWLLGEPMEIKSNKIAITQTQKPELFSHFLQKPVYPFIIRLDADEPNGFIRHWIINNMPWQRHIAYAIQWFIFGVIVIVIYLVRNIHYEKK